MAAFRDKYNFLLNLLFSWLLSRVVVIGAFEVTKRVYEHLSLLGTSYDKKVALLISSGFFGWDGGFYLQISKHGYMPSNPAEIRFFPFYPLVGFALNYLVSLGARLSLLVVSNGFAFLLGVVLYLLINELGFSSDVAKRSLWLYFFSPASFVTVTAYPEALFGFLATVYLLLVFKNKAILAFVVGAMAGLTRPTGIILVAVPFFLLVFEGFSAGFIFRPILTLKKIFACLGPVVGTLGFMIYSQVKLGNFFAPFSVQVSTKRRGSLVIPFKSISSNISKVTRDHFDILLHIPFILAALGLVIASFFVLRKELALYCAIFLLAIVITSNLDGFERYLLDCPPLFIVAAKLLKPPDIYRFVLLATCSAMIVFYEASLLGLYIP